ncbi:MAG: cyclic nucleotide-binding domain-containing protein [Jiangellales bacterium]
MAVEYSVSALLNQLRGVDLLREMDDDVLSVLAERVTVADYEPGAVVVAEGDEASGLFLILRGTALVERGAVPLAVVGVGEHIGEIALLDGQPRVATVRAQDDLRTGFLTSSDFLDVLEGSPSVALELLLAMTARFRMLEERLSEAEARLADAGD